MSLGQPSQGRGEPVLRDQILIVTGFLDLYSYIPTEYYFLLAHVLPKVEKGEKDGGKRG